MICAAVLFAICAGPAMTSTTAWRFPGTRRGRSLTATTSLMRTTRGEHWSGAGIQAPADRTGTQSDPYSAGWMNYHISSTKRLFFLGKANLIFQAQTFDWALSVRDNSLLDNDNFLAE